MGYTSRGTIQEVRFKGYDSRGTIQGKKERPRHTRFFTPPTPQNLKPLTSPLQLPVRAVDEDEDVVVPLGQVREVDVQGGGVGWDLRVKGGRRGRRIVHTGIKGKIVNLTHPKI